MPVLSTWTPEDFVLSVVAPLALGASVSTALVLDLDPDGPKLGGGETLAALVERGPTAGDLVPTRKGLAVLPNGGIEPVAAREVVEALIDGWPAVVLRLSGSTLPPTRRGIVPVRVLLPPRMLGPATEDPVARPAVFQRVGWHVDQPGPGPVLPRPRSRTVAALLAGHRPRPDRWLSAWRRVWALPWT